MGSGCNRDTGLRPGFASNYYYFFWLFGLVFDSENN